MIWKISDAGQGKCPVSCATKGQKMNLQTSGQKWWIDGILVREDNTHCRIRLLTNRRNGRAMKMGYATQVLLTSAFSAVNNASRVLVVVFCAGSTTQGAETQATPPSSTAPGHVVIWRTEGSEPLERYTERLEIGGQPVTDAIAISAGRSHALILRADGTVGPWGKNVEGQTNVPPGLKDVVQVAAGDFFSLALGADGKVSGWGLYPTNAAALRRR